MWRSFRYQGLPKQLSEKVRNCTFLHSMKRPPWSGVLGSGVWHVLTPRQVRSCEMGADPSTVQALRQGCERFVKLAVVCLWYTQAGLQFEKCFKHALLENRNVEKCFKHVSSVGAVALGWSFTLAAVPQILLRCSVRDSWEVLHFEPGRLLSLRFGSDG